MRDRLRERERDNERRRGERDRDLKQASTSVKINHIFSGLRLNQYSYLHTVMQQRFTYTLVTANICSGEHHHCKVAGFITFKTTSKVFLSVEHILSTLLKFPNVPKEEIG
ncbi:hypothetical protein J6590_017568 [Homalodisca vitripennis]|nr:hypothetical protein J6590_017568 [Homalodisca vitripennis]